MNPVLWSVALAAAALWLARPQALGRRPTPTDHEADDATPTTGGVARWRSTSARRRARRDTGPIELARWCESVARAVRGGDGLTAALDRVHAPEPVTAQLQARRRLDGNTRVAPPTPDVALVLAVVTACLDHGGPAAEPLDRAAGVLRARAAERAERQVQSAQARLSATVLTWLPVVMLLVLLATSGATRRVVASPYGVVLVVAGGALNAAGWWWMRRIIDRAAR